MIEPLNWKHLAGKFSTFHRQIGSAFPKLPKAFIAWVMPTPSGCWEWAGSLNSGGYGKWIQSLGSRAKRKHWAAHRFMYVMAVGEIKKGMHVCHHCDNRRCINPEHLFLGTAKDNVQDCISKGRRSKKRGSYNVGLDNHWAKLTKREGMEIYFDTREASVIAHAHGCSRQLVWRIKTHKHWSTKNLHKEQ